MGDEHAAEKIVAMEKRPSVSVVIPAYFSHPTLAGCLESLRRQQFHTFETILVNSSAEDTTGETVTGRFPEVRFFQSPQRLYPHAARNKGVEMASGGLLVFTDPDCTYGPDWLEQIVLGHRNGHPVVVGAMGHKSDSWFENGVHLTKFFEFLPGLPEGWRSIAPTANAAYDRAVWEGIGPFDGTIFTGDAVQSWKATLEGYPIRFMPKAVVYHRHEGDMGSFWRERWTRGAEFIDQRIRFFGWTPGRCLAYMAVMPLRLLHVLFVKAVLASFRSGWGLRYLWTLPVQFVGQLGWTLGEARGCWRHLTSRRP
jgi:GT2 family glycosyltransferase